LHFFFPPVVSFLSLLRVTLFICSGGVWDCVSPPLFSFIFFFFQISSCFKNLPPLSENQTLFVLVKRPTHSAFQVPFGFEFEDFTVRLFLFEGVFSPLSFLLSLVNISPSSSSFLPLFFFCFFSRIFLDPLTLRPGSFSPQRRVLYSRNRAPLTVSPLFFFFS